MMQARNNVMVKLLHAEELAKMAGVHKSTVLLAIRRGELRASRTAGRSARIAPEDARAYLRSRNRSIPPELEARGGTVQVAVLTDNTDVLSIVQQSVPEGAELIGTADLFESLILVGASTPTAVVLDLDMVFMNPMVVLRALRTTTNLRNVSVLALGVRDELFGAARAVGADNAVIKIDQKTLSALITKVVADAQRPFGVLSS